MRQVHLVRVHSEDLRLAVAALDLQRKQRLFRFAAKTNVAAVEKQIAGQLHGDGAGASRPAATREVPQSSDEHTWEINAPMLFEVLVFDGSDGVVEDSRALLVGHQDAPLQ